MANEPSARRRRLTYLAGWRAERIALLWLSLKGYRIVARRYAVRGGEVDLVVRRGAVLAFVEVKNRSALTEAMQAVTPTKRRRVDRAAAVWLSRNPWALNLILRGDIVAIAPWRLPRHLPGALQLRLGA